MIQQAVDLQQSAARIRLDLADLVELRIHLRARRHEPRSSGAGTSGCGSDDRGRGAYAARLFRLLLGLPVVYPVFVHLEFDDILAAHDRGVDEIGYARQHDHSAEDDAEYLKVAEEAVPPEVAVARADYRHQREDAEEDEEKDLENQDEYRRVPEKRHLVNPAVFAVFEKSDSVIHKTPPV